MTMEEKKKEYGNMRIMSLDGSNIWRHTHGVNGMQPFTALKNNGKLNPDAFDGILDASLDTDMLREVHNKHREEMKYPYIEQKLFCRALVAVSFKYAVKEYERYGQRYVKYGHTVTDEDMHDHICIRDGVLVAIEVPYNKDNSYSPVENPIDSDKLGKCFAYNAAKREYKVITDKISITVSTETIRETLYAEGFDIDGIHYVRYKRSAGASRGGKCLFIAEPLYADMMEWSSCGLSADDVSDQASWQAYISLTLSSIENVIRLPKKALLIIPDKVSKFKTTAVCVKEDATEGLIAVEEETEIENVLWDGEALMDVSVFEENGYAHKAMMLLRNRFFKTCAFNTNLQKWFADNGIEEIRQLDGYTTARKVSDIKLVVTESSIKYLKFMPKDMSYKDGFKAWLDAAYDGKTDISYGVVKTDKPTSNMDGLQVYTNYQLINTLAFTPRGLSAFTFQPMEMLERIYNDSIFLRYHINYFGDATPKEFLYPTVENYRRKVVLDMLFKTPYFEHTALYRDLRDDVCEIYKDRLKEGRLLVIGNNQTIFGNPYEFLYAVTNKNYEPTEPLLLYGSDIYTKRFDDGIRLTCARNPHITMGNLLVATNRHQEKIDEYFNLTKNICCINAIGYNIQQRLNGCDYDSDAMLVTNDTMILGAAEFCYELMGVPVCKVAPAGKAEYTSSAVSFAKLDRTISKNKIGEIVNLSQFLNSLFWHRKYNGESLESLMPLYREICKLAVLSGMEIDKAKRMYAVKTNTVLKNLRKYKKEYTDANGGKLPNFFYYITKQKTEISDDNQAALDTAMSYLYNRAYEPVKKLYKHPKASLLSLFSLDVKDKDNRDSRVDVIIKTVKDAENAIRHLQAKEEKADEDDKVIFAERKNKIFFECLKSVTKNVVSDDILYHLLAELDANKNPDVKGARSLLFASLLYEENHRLLSKVVTPEGYQYIELRLHDPYTPLNQELLTVNILGYDHIFMLNGTTPIGSGGGVKIVDGKPMLYDQFGNPVPEKLLAYACPYDDSESYDDEDYEELDYENTFVYYTDDNNH